jgi:hypothetical protein
VHRVLEATPEQRVGASGGTSVAAASFYATAPVVPFPSSRTGWYARESQLPRVARASDLRTASSLPRWADERSQGSLQALVALTAGATLPRFLRVYTFTMSVSARGGTAGDFGHPEAGDLGHPEAAAAGRYRVRSPARPAATVSQAGGKPREAGRYGRAARTPSSLNPRWSRIGAGRMCEGARTSRGARSTLRERAHEAEGV